MRDSMLEIRPIYLREANEYVRKYHRHSIPTVGGRFALACYTDAKICGVAICGRPVSRYLDNGTTLEIYRVCTDGERNACSKLYGACCRVAREMGYKTVITYTLEHEIGASLRASGFICEGIAGGLAWSGKRSRGYYVAPREKKIRWMMTLD